MKKLIVMILTTVMYACTLGNAGPPPLPNNVRLKESVELDITDEILKAIQTASLVWEEYGVRELVITSGSDGVHSPNSKHYEGNAVDIRKWNIPESKRDCVVITLRLLLGDEYQVILEDTHIHVEYDPEG